MQKLPKKKFFEDCLTEVFYFPSDDVITTSAGGFNVEDDKIDFGNSKETVASSDRYES